MEEKAPKKANVQQLDRQSEGAYRIAELEQMLRKERAMNLECRKKLDEFKKVVEDSLAVKRIKEKQKAMENEIEQWKKLYEESHAKSIFLDRKMASLKLDQVKEAKEMQKPQPVIQQQNNEVDFRVEQLEKQVCSLMKRCDEKESEISELNEVVRGYRAEISDLKLADVSVPKTNNESEIDLYELLRQEYRRRQQEPSFNPLDMCCTEQRIAIEQLMKQKTESQCNASHSLTIEKRKLKEEVNTLNVYVEQLRRRKEELENEKNFVVQELEKKETTINLQKTEIKRLLESVQGEVAKRCELEEEVHKQRVRTTEIIDSKEDELEACRKMLVALRNEKLRLQRQSSNSSALEIDDRDFRESSNGWSEGDSRNVFYENQLAKKEMDINELRKQLLDVEFRLREHEQLTMSRQLEAIANADQMKDKVRALEGKLQMLSSSNEIDYLRNIFKQFVHCMPTPSPQSRVILKAMGNVLKLPDSELKFIDKK